MGTGYDSMTLELTTVINMLVNRLREWYGYYYPEFVKETYSNEEFAEKILSLSKPKESMGADLDKKDIAAMFDLAKQVNSLYSLKKEMTNYLEKAMKEVCPNLDAVADSFIGAKLKESSLGKRVQVIGYILFPDHMNYHL